jgi:hypothetical protein
MHSGMTAEGGGKKCTRRGHSTSHTSLLQESCFCFASTKRECMLTPFMPPERQPFIYRPRRKKVTAAQAMDLVRDKGANCHQFDVNPHDAPASVDAIAAQITELSQSPQDDSESALAIATLQEAMQSVQRRAYGVASLLAKPEAGAWNVITVGQNHRVANGSL